ncbi:inner nuclear membrane protein Man1-like [Centruroides vittatus]|uniref:inner nuclear membrane protein Man1-like n=1 Tax=Centruroides vittatus TaxID=120091 RepID=UPI00350FF2FD
MASTLSDEELREKLEELGEKVGPITHTTRKVYEMKLDKAMQQRKTKRRSSNKLELSRFSSDENEMDGKGSKTSTSSTSSRRHIRPRRSIVSGRSQSTNDQVDSNAFKIPDIPTSRTLTNSNRSPSPSTYLSSDLTRTSVRSSRRLRRQKLNNFDIDSSDSDIDLDHHNRFKKKQVQSERTNLENNIDSSSHYNWDNSFYKTEKFDNNDKTKAQVSTGLNHLSTKANGYTSDDSTLRKVFKVEDDTVSNTNYSQCISMFLVIVATLFFVVVGILYVGVKQKELPLGEIDPIKPFEGDNNSNQNSVDIRNIAILLYNLLSHIAGAYECNEKQASRSLSYKDAKVALIEMCDTQQRETFEENFSKALDLIMKNKDWGITIYNEHGKIAENLTQVHSLEAVIATKSLWCRFWQAFLQTSFKLLCFALILIVIVGIFFTMKLYKKKKALEQKKVFSLVEDIIDLLKKQNEKRKASSDVEPVLAIAHVRDMLIPPAERKSYLQLWEKAVKFLEENESRVRVERQTIEGEDYKVWRWLQPSTPELGGKSGKVWQGQAFGNTGKGINVLPYSPTPCLKIRNMFDSEEEYEDDWQLYIKDAILEKCENNNSIVHIQVDTSSNEGCVYLKCLSPESAGQAYRALHGWWFNRRLVTVKYLRLERYHERFPESEFTTTPLKPSNNMRLSLSAPFHSSPLESS